MGFYGVRLRTRALQGSARIGIFQVSGDKSFFRQRSVYEALEKQARNKGVSSQYQAPDGSREGFSPAPEKTIFQNKKGTKSSGDRVSIARHEAGSSGERPAHGLEARSQEQAQKKPAPVEDQAKIVADGREHGVVPIAARTGFFTGDELRARCPEDRRQMSDARRWHNRLPTSVI